MTDHGNLRDRIAAQITPFLYWNYADWEDADERDKADARECSQAIIDELGLRVETEPGHDPRECGCSSRAYPAESRVVGKWEVEQ